MGAIERDAEGYRIIGKHRVRAEPPDVIHAILVGDITESDIPGLLDAVGELPAASHVFLLRDARRGGVPSRQARELIVKHPNIRRLRTVITCGAPFHETVAVSMIGRAMRFFLPNAPSFHFVPTVAEGRALIDELRAQSRG